MPKKIYRVLNNNAVVVLENDTEVIYLGSGIAFQKKKGQMIEEEVIEKTFVNKEEQKKIQQLLETVPSRHVAVGETIISMAEKELGQELSEHIYATLIDHISFAVQRHNEGIVIRNKLLHEIRFLYKIEFQIGSRALEIIKEDLDIELPLDEAAHIALHVHTAKFQTKQVSKMVEKANILQDMIDIITSEFKINIRQEDIAYQRLITHLNFALSRSQNEQNTHTLDPDMVIMIKNKYKEEFACAKKAVEFVNEEYRYYLPEFEAAYIALHAARLRMNDKDE